MSCTTPIDWPSLVQYWARDLPEPEAEQLEEHLMACATCSAESARVAALVTALDELIAPVVDRARLESLRARGLRLRENVFVPGQKAVVFPRDADLLVHRLSGFELSTAVRVRVTVRGESSGQVYVEDPNAPFDPRVGVLVVCQAHFAELPPDIAIDVHAVEASGVERSATYSIPHVFEPR